VFKCIWGVVASVSHVEMVKTIANSARCMFVFWISNTFGGSFASPSVRTHFRETQPNKNHIIHQETCAMSAKQCVKLMEKKCNRNIKCIIYVMYRSIYFYSSCNVVLGCASSPSPSPPRSPTKSANTDNHMKQIWRNMESHMTYGRHCEYCKKFTNPSAEQLTKVRK